MRAFVAVWPSEPVRRALRRLDRPDRPDVRWITEDQWHVTLVFLGDVEPRHSADFARALEGAAAGCDPVTAVLGPRTERSGPGLLWVPVRGLEAVAGAVRGAVEPLGCPQEAEVFRGHLTVARSRRRRRLPAGLAGAPLSATWEVGEISLVTSVLEPSGARYEVVAAARLAPR